MSNAPLPISMTEFARHMLRAPNARGLAAKMVELAEQSVEYRPIFLAWARHGSTIKLRDAAEPFGRYWDDIEFANLVDTLDSWAGKFVSATSKV